jgi:hypothetical protein
MVRRSARTSMPSMRLSRECAESRTVCHFSFCTEARPGSPQTPSSTSPPVLEARFSVWRSCLPNDVRALNDRAKELDLKLPLRQSTPAIEERLEGALDTILRNGKQNIVCWDRALKPLLTTCARVRTGKAARWGGPPDKDESVSLGGGSAQQGIPSTMVIPHIGSLMCSSLKEIRHGAELVILGTRAVDREAFRRNLRPGSSGD